MRAMQVALSIAGSDPTGGAGLQADLQVFRTLGVHGAGVITALTIQDTAKVHRVLPAFPNVVLDQLRVLLADLRPHAVKIGMLATDDVARSVELGLAPLEASGGPPVPVVVDPVLAASDGTSLLERRAWNSLERLIGRATLVTPNLPEAEALTGCDVSSDEGVEAAGCALVSNLGAGAALVKGGHREGPPHDLLVLREGGSQTLHWLEGERVEAGPVHGTGCALSSAIAAYLARGDPLRTAVERGRRFVAKALAGAAETGKLARFLAYFCAPAPSRRRTGSRRAPQVPGGPSKTPGQRVPQARQRPSPSRFHSDSTYQSRPIRVASQPLQ
jgi:hydroxymethylpyrimidine/phosphomethylpyrimidine kinase